MVRIIGLLKKEFIHFYRDPVSLLLILYYFSACIILCAYSFTIDVDHLRTVIYDMSRTHTSRDIIQRFLSNEYFDLDSYATNMTDVQERLDSGKARVALIIPPELTRYLAEGRPAPIQFISDGSDANLSGQGVGFAKRIISQYNETLILEKLNRQGVVIKQLPGIQNQLRTFYNQEMVGEYFVVIYHIVIAGLLGGLILSSTAIVREKERGTIDQLLVTPTRPWELLLAKTVVPLLIGLIATIFSFLTIFWFDVPCYGNPLTFIMYMGFFLIGMTGLGALIGTVCSNMLQSILLCFGVLFPSVFLCGAITPIENLPPLLQKISQFNPPTHLLLAANGILQKGNGFLILWPEALKLLGIGAALFFVGGYITSKQWH